MVMYNCEVFLSHVSLMAGEIKEFLAEIYVMMRDIDNVLFNFNFDFFNILKRKYSLKKY